MSELSKWRRWARPQASTGPLCGVALPEGKLPPVEWYCAKLNKSSTDIDELSRLNGNCPGCIDEAHLIGKCDANPHRNIVDCFAKIVD